MRPTGRCAAHILTTPHPRTHEPLECQILIITYTAPALPLQAGAGIPTSTALPQSLRNHDNSHGSKSHKHKKACTRRATRRPAGPPHSHCALPARGRRKRRTRPREHAPPRLHCARRRKMAPTLECVRPAARARNRTRARTCRCPRGTCPTRARPGTMQGTPRTHRRGECTPDLPVACSVSANAAFFHMAAATAMLQV